MLTYYVMQKTYNVSDRKHYYVAKMAASKAFEVWKSNTAIRLCYMLNTIQIYEDYVHKDFFNLLYCLAFLHILLIWIIYILYI